MKTGRPRKPAGRATRPNRYVGQPAAPFTPAAQPPLPTDRVWSPGTVEWWEVWGESDYADFLTAVDWESLLTAAVLRERVFVEGELRFAAELRIVQQNLRDVAEKRIIHNAGVASVRPQDLPPMDVEVVDSKELETLEVVKIAPWRESWFKANHPGKEYLIDDTL